MGSVNAYSKLVYDEYLRRGYTDAAFGKDRTEVLQRSSSVFKDVYLKAYRAGQLKFLRDFKLDFEGSF